jgi:hypothetical protein
VFSEATVVLMIQDYAEFSVFSSSIHTDWAWKNSGKMGSSTLRFSPTDCFENFPFPKKSSALIYEILESIGLQYYQFRRQLMLKLQIGLTKTYNAFHNQSVRLGITSQAVVQLNKKVIEKEFGEEVWNLWNHLQKTTGTCSLEEAIEGIVQLRALHVQMDLAVLEAYGWEDITLRHDFYEVDYLPENDRVRYTIHPEARKEILKRLLELNHKIHEEEVKAGLWDKKKGKSGDKDKDKKKTNIEIPSIDYGLDDETPLVAREQQMNSSSENEIKEGAVVTLISHDDKEIRISIGKSITNAMSISTDSPFGQALLGRKTGDYISFGKGFTVVAIE